MTRSRRLLAQLRRPLLHDRVDFEPGVPDVECAALREVLHRQPVRAHGREIRFPPVLPVEPALATGDLEARDQALDVPLERAGKRLVEVVQAEDEPPVGGCEDAEVEEMRVARELNGQPGPRRRREICRHDRGRAAEEGKRRKEHAPVPDRHELRDARSRLLLEQPDGIGPIWRRLPVGVLRASNLGSSGLSARSPLGRCLMLGSSRHLHILDQARPGRGRQLVTASRRRKSRRPCQPRRKCCLRPCEPTGRPSALPPAAPRPLAQSLRPRSRRWCA